MEEVQAAKATLNVQPGSQEAPITVDSPTDDDTHSASVELSRVRSPVPSQAQSVAGVDAEGSDCPRDDLSLMSEDPDDEDAIPEWLM